MKARQARELAIKAMDKDTECHKEIERVYKEIEERAKQGKLGAHVTVPYRYHDYVITKLKENGYKLCIVFEKFEISW